MTLRPRRRRGAALAEMMISILLMAVAVSALSGTMINGATNKSRLQNKDQGALYLNHLLQALGNYASADASAATQALAPEGCWNLRVPPVTGPCPPGWALDPGSHDATFLLPASFSMEPYRATLTYTVTLVNGLPQVEAALDWAEPGA